MSVDGILPAFMHIKFDCIQIGLSQAFAHASHAPGPAAQQLIDRSYSHAFIHYPRNFQIESFQMPRTRPSQVGAHTAHSWCTVPHRLRVILAMILSFMREYPLALNKEIITAAHECSEAPNGFHKLGQFWNENTHT
jgi:hypothetical protein